MAADQIKAITGRIRCPQSEIHPTDDHFNVIHDRIHCPPDEIKVIARRLKVIAGRIYVIADRKKVITSHFYPDPSLRDSRRSPDGSSDGAGAARRGQGVGTARRLPAKL